MAIFFGEFIMARLKNYLVPIERCCLARLGDNRVNNHINEDYMRVSLSLAVVITVLLSACVPARYYDPTLFDPKSSSLSQGNVQLLMEIGVTTKAEVLETFGAPNVTTRDGDGREVWSYQRQATLTQAGTSEFFVSGVSQTSRMMTLIIKFDENDVLADYSSRESNF